MKNRIYQWLEVSPAPNRTSHLTHSFLMVLILSNVLVVILESVHTLKARFGREFFWFDVLSVSVFTVEYLLRLWVCTSHHKYRSPLWGRIRFALSPFALIDLLAILPFYLPFAHADLRFLRGIRIFRMLRILKIGRYSDGFNVLGKVVREKRHHLAASFTVLFTLLIIGACTMYETEHLVQPDKFSNIPAALYWATETMATVGYGDVYPITGIGKFIGALIAILGIAAFALPTAIIGAGFVEQIHARKEILQFCLHCGYPMQVLPRIAQREETTLTTGPGARNLQDAERQYHPPVLVDH
ncbi:MAG: ion transporter [Acidobacteriia bacterium]|nr:ion transporter [Terriglobia bacterium]